jgi:DNA invertase Pin-like site-specific DNA recombinase
MKKVKRVALYARVSSDEQARFGYSVGNQVDRLIEYAKEKNHIVVDVFVDDGYTAGNTKRPELQRMLSMLKEIDEIIFTKLDRFSRNVLDANEIVNECFREKVGIRAIDEDDIDTTTADGMFNFNLKVSLAQRELAKGSERIITVFDFMVKQGKPITGNMPFGYKIAENEKGKYITKDKEVEHIVDELFVHFITYQSIRGTSRYINDKYNLNFSYNTYSSILRKEFYAGTYRGNTEYCPQYITRETFDRVQEIIQNNIKIRKANHVHLFSGLMRCPNCGKKMQIHFRERKNKNGTKKQYRYYRCISHLASAVPCGIHYREEMIEEKLLQDIKKQAEEYIYKVSVSAEKTQIDGNRIKEITEEIDRLNYSYQKKRISIAKYDEEYDLLEKELAKANREAPKKKDLSGIEAFLNSGWENVYESLCREDKRALIRSVVKSISFNDSGEIKIDFI